MIRQDIEIVQGADHALTVTLDGSGDITGQAFALAVRPRGPGRTLAGAAAFQVSTAAGNLVVTDGPGRVLTATISAANSTLLAPGGAYLYDLARTDTGSRVPLVGGDVTVLASPTLGP